MTENKAVEKVSGENALENKIPDFHVDTNLDASDQAKVLNKYMIENNLVDKLDAKVYMDPENSGFVSEEFNNARLKFLSGKLDSYQKLYRALSGCELCPKSYCPREEAVKHLYVRSFNIDSLEDSLLHKKDSGENNSELKRIEKFNSLVTGSRLGNRRGFKEILREIKRINKNISLQGEEFSDVLETLKETKKLVETKLENDICCKWICHLCPTCTGDGCDCCPMDYERGCNSC